MGEVRRVHYNKPQLKAGYVDAQEMVCIWGRGTGKSEGLIAPKALRCAFGMPRSVGVFLAATFQQMLSKTLPPVLSGWERLNCIQGRDFVFGEKPPEHWPRPRQPRLDHSRSFSFRNGSAIMLASQERAGSLNGPSIDYIIGDEAKFLKKDRYENEALPAMRGNHEHFGASALHQSILLCTDMPTEPSARWLLEKENDMDDEVIALILALQQDVFKLKQALSGGLAASTAANYRQRLARLLSQVNELRKGTVYYSEASALDNIDALKLSYLARMKRVLPPFIFDTAILNKRVDRVEGGFYPGLDIDVHTYIAPTTTYAMQRELTKGEVERDCRWDPTFVDSLPLDFAMDYGANFNCMLVAQLFDRRFNIDNCLFTTGKIRELCRTFDAYYRYRSCRDLFYHFDHTAVGESAAVDYSFSDEVIRELSKLGWTVTPCFMGRAPAHHDKYVFLGRVFARDPEYPEIWINRVNCEYYLMSMQLAAARQTRKGFEKDKTSERDPNTQPSEATHLSDAGDQLLWGRFHGMHAGGGVPAVALFG